MSEKIIITSPNEIIQHTSLQRSWISRWFGCVSEDYVVYGHSRYNVDKMISRCHHIKMIPNIGPNKTQIQQTYKRLQILMKFLEGLKNEEVTIPVG